jgi:PHP family Zn ribbon phosphoesterase
LEAAAADAVRKYPGAVVYFKFTCAHCGHRCTFTEPNALYERGECNACGKETEIKKGGFLLQLRY